MRTKNSLMALLLIAAGLILFISSIASLPADDMATVPDGYAGICSADMSEARSNAVIYGFELDAEKQTSFYIWTNMSAEKNVRLTGPGNMTVDLLNGESTINQSDIRLEPGKYEITVTNPAGKGDLFIYSKS